MGQRQSAEEDVAQYLQGYPDLVDDPSLSLNEKFFKNLIPCQPDGLTLDQVHTQWNYDWLEEGHGYIQWLFPIREEGLNHLAHKLQPHEARAILADEGCIRRFRMSYRMMLDFYGIVLVDEASGALERSTRCLERFQNLCLYSHNFLRITRILKCLGELGHEHYKLPLIQFFIHEVFGTRALIRCRHSLLNYWAPSLRVKAERDAVAAQLEELAVIEDLRVPSSALVGERARRMSNLEEWTVPESRPPMSQHVPEVLDGTYQA